MQTENCQNVILITNTVENSTEKEMDVANIDDMRTLEVNIDRIFNEDIQNAPFESNVIQSRDDDNTAKEVENTNSRNIEDNIGENIKTTEKECKNKSENKTVVDTEIEKSSDFIKIPETLQNILIETKQVEEETSASKEICDNSFQDKIIISKNDQPGKSNASEICTSIETKLIEDSIASTNIVEDNINTSKNDQTENVMTNSLVTNTETSCTSTKSKPIEGKSRSSTEVYNKPIEAEVLKSKDDERVMFTTNSAVVDEETNEEDNIRNISTEPTATLTTKNAHADIETTKTEGGGHTVLIMSAITENDNNKVQFNVKSNIDKYNTKTGQVSNLTQTLDDNSVQQQSVKTRDPKSKEIEEVFPVLEVIEIDERRFGHVKQEENRTEPIEISDDDSQVKQKTLSLSSSLVELYKSKAVRNILIQIKKFTSSEYLLFYTQLPLKNKESSSATTKTNGKDALIKEMISKKLNSSSLELVEALLGKVQELSPYEYIQFQTGLPSDGNNTTLHQFFYGGQTTTNQTLLWIKTHIEEAHKQVIPKQEIYNDYSIFCTRTDTHVLTTSMFGKLMKQTFPCITQRRLRTPSGSLYHYVGIRRRCILPKPSLPKLDKKSNPTHLFKEEKLENQDNLKGNDYYKSSELNGKTILVHDPLALLSISTSDTQPTFEQGTNINKFSRPMRNVPKYMIKLPSIAPKSRNNSNKPKFKAYRHPSVKKLFRKYRTIHFPEQYFRYNLNPAVALDKNEANNWFAQRLQNLKTRVTNINIVRLDRSRYFQLTCTACKDVFEVGTVYAEQLQKLQNNLSNIFVKRDKNYTVYHGTEPKTIDLTTDEMVQNPTLNLPIPQNVTVANSTTTSKKRLCGPRSKIEKFKSSPSKLLTDKFKDVIIPDDVLKCNLDPVIVLDSGEVFAWYQEQLSRLRGNSNVEDNIPRKLPFSDRVTNKNISIPQQSCVTQRQTRAKAINFCEIDSSDYDTDHSTVEQLHVMESTPILEGETILSEITGQMITSKVVNSHVAQKRIRSNTDQMEELQPKKFKSEEDMSENSPNICFFCNEVFLDQKMLVEHRKQHLTCRTCKKRLKTFELMRVHLINHCVLNYTRSKPILKIFKIDKIKSIAKRYARAFKEPVPIYREIAKKSVTRSSAKHVKNRDASNIRTYSKLPSSTSVQFIQGIGEIGQTSSTQIEAPDMVQLKNQISSNLNKILLLPSGNNLPVLGTIYLNNGQSSPILNVNPSCSKPEMPQTFMQIVEGPNNTIQYTNQPNIITLTQHQDHSYYLQNQQPVFQIANNLSNMNNIVFVTNNVPQCSPQVQTTSGDISVFQQSITIDSESASTNNPSQSQFKIRVKSLQELR